MNFRTIAQMNEHIIAGLARVPRDIDLIVGIPRSGMLPATILALYLNKALTDVDGLLAGRIMPPGLSRAKFQAAYDVSSARKILVIDDSCDSGQQLQAVRARIAAAALKAQVIYAAVYVAPEARDRVELFFDVCPMPRAFEWNLMHHPMLKAACVDIDGVLCCDPTEEENDDGENYRRFLDEAKPLWIPTVQVGWLVTSRLEKYRSQTENWLARYQVRYDELVMLNMATAAERRAARCHGSFKGGVYRSKGAQLFIESDPDQAHEIAQFSFKPVFCLADQQFYLPSTKTVAREILRKLPSRAPSIGWRLLSRARKWLR